MRLTMLRRQFLAALAGVTALLSALWIAARTVCPRAAIRVSERDAPTIANLMRDRISVPLDNVYGREFRFDPLTLLTLVGLLIQIVQACRSSSVSRLHAAVQRRPFGTVARKLRGKLNDQIQCEDPSMDRATAFAQADASVTAFIDATPEEIAALHADLARMQDSPTLVTVAEFAHELEAIE